MSIKELTHLLDNMSIGLIDSYNINQLGKAFDKLTLSELNNDKNIDELTSCFNKLSMYDISLLEEQFSNMKINDNKLLITTKYGTTITIELNCHTNFVRVQPLFIPNWTTSY